MANQLRNLLAAVVVTIAGFGTIPAAANAAPSVIASFAEQVATNKTRFTLMFDAPIEGLTREDFRASAGCTIAYVEVQEATAQVELLDCPSGLVELALLANSVGSSTLGPSESHVLSIEIDALAPTARFSEIQIQGSGPFTYATNLRFSEPVDFDISRLQFTSDAVCQRTETAFENGWRLVAVCDFATISWSLPSKSLKDAAGNRGPASGVEVSISNLRPSPSPSPLPPAPAPQVSNPEPTPISPAPILIPLPIPEIPTSSSEVPQPSGSTVSEALEVISSESNAVDWDSEAVVVTITAAATGQQVESESGQDSVLTALQAKSESAVAITLKPAEVAKTNVAIETAAGDAAQFEDPKRGQWVLLVGLGSLALLATGLIRRFSGR